MCYEGFYTLYTISVFEVEMMFFGAVFWGTMNILSV